MDNQDRVNNQLQIEDYLFQKNVYGHLQELLKGLIVDQPQSPIDYLIARLQESEQKRIFIVGPPGFKLQELALSIADSRGEGSDKLGTFSIGDQISKEYNKKTALTSQIQEAMHSFSYVGDSIVNEIAGAELEKRRQEGRSYIIEGYPKTLSQAIFLQRSNVHPTSLIILNMGTEKIMECCMSKIMGLQHFNHMSGDRKADLARQHMQEYLLNIDKVKQVYNGSYSEIDAGKGANTEKLLEDADRILTLRVGTKVLKKPIQILVHGYPSSVRTPLGKQIAEKYGLVFVSSPNLIANEIVRNTPDGMLMRQNFEKGDLVNQATILKLVKARVTQKDCKLRGFVLEGFPKTETQLQYLQFMGIKPTLFILLDDARIPRPPIPIHNQTPEAQDRSRIFNGFIESNYTGSLLKLDSGESFKNILQEICFMIQRL